MRWRKPNQVKRENEPAPESLSVPPLPPQAPSFLPRDRHCPDLCGTWFLLHLLDALFSFCLFLNFIEMDPYIVYSFTFGCLHTILCMLFIMLALKTSETNGKLLSFLYRERNRVSMSAVVVWTGLCGVCAKPHFGSCHVSQSHPVSAHLPLALHRVSRLLTVGWHSGLSQNPPLSALLSMALGLFPAWCY